MTLFQGSADGFWLVVTALAGVLISVAIWYMVIIGRERPIQRVRRGESTAENYSDLQESHAPVPKFLIYTFAGTIVWAIGYLFWTGINGVTGYR